MHADSALPETHLSVFVCLALLGVAIVFETLLSYSSTEGKNILKLKQTYASRVWQCPTFWREVSRFPW